MDSSVATIIIVVGVALGFLWSIKFYKETMAVEPVIDKTKTFVTDESADAKLIDADERKVSPDDIQASLDRVSKAIQEGAQGFLMAEYQYMAVFMLMMSVVLVIFLGVTDGEWTNAILTMIAFVIGSSTSILSGWIGMQIAVFANVRTTVTAYNNPNPGDFGPAFTIAFKAGAVMGFSLVALAIMNLYILVCVYSMFFDISGEDGQTISSHMYECIAGYGLGGSSIALFGRVGGGIYTKAADVGADLFKLDGLEEDDPRNPAVIADNVGDNVGDIAGMGADLFGSFAESSCAAMVISATSPDLYHDWAVMAFPMLVASSGVLVCIVTSLFATECCIVAKKVDVEASLKRQLLISTFLMTPVAYVLAISVFPSEFAVSSVENCKAWYIFACIACGLWSGLAIGLITEYYTSNTHAPTKELAEKSATGAATNIIYGLALGYKSVIIPVFCLAITIYISYTLAGMYGVACGAIGILSTLSIGLTIDAYGPICDNAGGIAEMSEMPGSIRVVTDALDAAGNTTAAIGKGFAIGSAAMVALALFGAFVTAIQPGELPVVDILDAWVFSGLLVGAMLPYWFSAMTMKSVGEAANDMIIEVQRQFDTMDLLKGYPEVMPEYAKCVEISTKASLAEMVPPGCLVILTPLITGYLFGVKCLAGLLAGVLVSGVQMAISASNSGGAWDNAKKLVEETGMKHTKVHVATVIGDTVGDPMKDTSGPSLNILIKLTAIISLVFGPSMASDFDSPGLIQKLFQ